MNCLIRVFNEVYLFSFSTHRILKTLYFLQQFVNMYVRVVYAQLFLKIYSEFVDFRDTQSVVPYLQFKELPRFPFY